MAFINQLAGIDLGTTEVENIFITDYMPSANGTYVKVYLIGYKIAGDHLSSANAEFDNYALAKYLDLPLQDILSAWDYWEKRGAINKIMGDDPFNFDVEFMSLRQLYIESNYTINKNANIPQNAKSESVSIDDLIEANQSEAIRQMFYDCEMILRRTLYPNEQREILAYLLDYSLDPEFIVRAFEYSVEVKGIRKPKYALGILKNWRDEGILTHESLMEKLSENGARVSIYRKIYKAMGYANRSVSSGDKEIIDKWLDKDGLTEAFILDKIREFSKKTNNPNINYMDSIMNRSSEPGTSVKNDYPTKKPTKSTNKFNAYHTNKTNYSNDELEKILGIRKKT